MPTIITLVRAMVMVNMSVIHGRGRVRYQCEECKWEEVLWWKPECVVPCPICNVARLEDDGS